MRFTTEALPRLRPGPGVAVEVSGEPPDYREAGDIARIGVSTAEVAGERDWFDLGVTITVEGREVPFAEVFVALAAGESHLLLADGAYFSLRRAAAAGAARADRGGPRAARTRRGGRCGSAGTRPACGTSWPRSASSTEQAQAWQRAGRAAAGARRGRPSTSCRPALHARAAALPARGLRLAGFLWEHGLGGILADDMGLGKTLQTLALICHAQRAPTRTIGPFLVVAPDQRGAELGGRGRPVRPGAHGCDGHRHAARRGAHDLASIAGADVVVTSYTLFRLDVDAYAVADWAGLILDEAQFVKNHQSKTYQCVRELPAPFKLAITGTPMENNLMELWSLLSITAPGLFPDPKRFAEHYARPIERGGDAERLARLRRRIRPLVLRRTKEQVAADLPAKQEQVLEVELAPAPPQALRHPPAARAAEGARACSTTSTATASRSCARSPCCASSACTRAWSTTTRAPTPGSAKLDALVEQLDDVVGRRPPGAGVQPVHRLPRAGPRPAGRAQGIDYCYLDGSTRPARRVIEHGSRTATAPVFLISLKAGGFGLNLTEADYCFLLDPWWNPATEARPSTAPTASARPATSWSTG